MEVSDTLGVRPVDTQPIMQFAAAQSQGLQQLGAQVQDDLTTITTNHQLNNLGAALSNLDPTDEKFPVKMAQAVMANPLAAHTPVGIAAINQLGQAHIWAGRVGAQMYGIDSRADVGYDRNAVSAENNQNTNQTRLQTNANTNATSTANTTARDATSTANTQAQLDSKQNLFSQAEIDKYALQGQSDWTKEDMQANQIQAAKDAAALKAQGVSPQLAESRAKVGINLANALQENEKNQGAWKQNPTDPGVIANAKGSETKVGILRDLASSLDEEIAKATGKVSQPTPQVSAPQSVVQPKAAPVGAGAAPSAPVPQGPPQASAQPAGPREMTKEQIAALPKGAPYAWNGKNYFKN
jgi:hypothetical protein